MFNRLTTAFLIAVWLLTPDFLCLLPGGEMLTMDEHECCRLMAGQCDSVPMPNFHECCQSVTRSDVVITTRATDYPELSVADVSLAGAAPRDLSPAVTFPHKWLRPADTTSLYSSFRESIDILRI